ncbi:lipopolysaccharide kinase InaA family protein [Aeromonas allosaccharophila]|uniref:lipopolysaccharide kinase InaA family protein n=1 Tax=Aeromonas allosaccharophila TaxID=656 RepID=UPI003D1B4FAE
MTLTTLDLHGKKRYYLLLHDELGLDHWALQQSELTRRLESIASSQFWLHPASNSLCKIVPDKYPRWSLGWWRRDLLGKRLVGHIDALREWQSNRRLRKAGLQVVPCKAAGIALNPLNPHASFLAVHYLAEHCSGEHYFKQAGENDRLALLHRLAQDLYHLAKHGYYHRDLHLGNLMLSPAGNIVWIDTHVRRLPSNLERLRQTFLDSLEPKKLFGQFYRDYLLAQLRRLAGLPQPQSITP